MPTSVPSFRKRWCYNLPHKAASRNPGAAGPPPSGRGATAAVSAVLVPVGRRFPPQLLAPCPRQPTDKQELHQRFRTRKRAEGCLSTKLNQRFSRNQCFLMFYHFTAAAPLPPSDSPRALFRTFPPPPVL